MAVRKEQVVLGGAVLVLGWMLWSTRDEGASRAQATRRAHPPELTKQVVPDPKLAMPEPRATSDRPPRDLFSPPSDTHPLPPLDLQPIPLAPLAMLAPPPEPGPLPSLYGKYLRTAPFTLEAAGLFATEQAADAGPSDAAAAAATPPPKASELSAEERALRISGYKKLYDWVRTVEFKFGEIRNPDRYQLPRHGNEDILFVEFNPETGKAKLPGQAPVPLSRSLVTEFGFADTVQNQVEKGRAELDDPLTATQYAPALAFADWCVEQHLETPRALEVAEEIYRRAMPVFNEDPLPHLGLARCYEAGFQFERAFQEYQSLLAGTHARDPLVLARLAELEARFRLFDEAEAHFVDAERYGRTQWSVQQSFGRFLLSRRRAQAAVEHLRLASQNEPSGAERKRERARIRADLAAALLGAGDLAGASEWYEKARQADPSEPSVLVGALSTSALAPNRAASDGGAAAPASDLTGASFDLLLASGIVALSRHDVASATRAKESLVAAAAADPLRAHFAWRALSFLAEVTGNPAEALRFAEQAVENDPSDPYALYQRGRILAARDDLDGAMESFSRALEIELDFPDALAAMGEIQNRRGEFAAAERYLERALAIDPRLAAVAALRGVNFLGLGSVADAEKSFQAALAIEKDQPTAQSGLAWCRYLRGETQESLTQLAEIDDHRRTFPETDPHRAWARAQLARIQDHVQKFAWTDRFERTDLMNGWQRDERAGPQVSIHDGVVTLGGSFTQQNGLARFWQVRGASAWVSFEARLTIHADTAARVGIFVSRETERSGESAMEAEVTISRNPEPGKNTTQTRVAKRGEEELDYTDVPGFEWKPDVPVVVRIERTGESSDTRVRCLVDGFPVLDNKAVPNLGRTTSDLRIGVFARGNVGRKVLVDVDDVEIVCREKK
ncbi:MAG TPA: tetratricopeptide repeat protein [Planctomycetota bacterium]|nr:tetratricopeptide repeat protein [Planctomycetota bacterium]